MDHIFGDTDEIGFGKSSVPSSPSPMPHTGRQFPVPRKQWSHWSKPVINRTTATSERKQITWTQVSLSNDIASIDTSSALSRLITGMKPSFLPRDEDMTNVRIIALSWHNEKDPLFLIRQDDTTILVGSWFGSIHQTGREYPTFPDMRLIFSEKDRIRAWILTDASIDVSRFEFILQTLGFPPIYATRDVIALFRNKLKDSSILESCRFFEIFSDGMRSRRIGDIECFVGNIHTRTVLAFRAGGSTFGFSHLFLASWESGMPVAHIFGVKEDSFQFGSEKFVMGEVLLLKWNNISRNSMKFTLDTFFVDGLSIGVVAGYTLWDREQLAENGVLIFTLEEDSRARTIAGHIFIDSRGFVHAYEMMYIHKEILKGIRASYEKFLTENPKIERGELVQWLRREITKYCYLLTGRTPVVMPIVIER